MVLMHNVFKLHFLIDASLLEYHHCIYCRRVGEINFVTQYVWKCLAHYPHLPAFLVFNYNDSHLPF